MYNILLLRNFLFGEQYWNCGNGQAQAPAEEHRDVLCPRLASQQNTGLSRAIPVGPSNLWPQETLLEKREPQPMTLNGKSLRNISARQDYPLQPQEKLRCKSEVLPAATVPCTTAQHLHRLHQEKEEEWRFYCHITTCSGKCKDTAGTDSSWVAVHGDPSKHGEKERKDEKLLHFPLICAPAQRKQKILWEALLWVSSDQ